MYIDYLMSIVSDENAFKLPLLNKCIPDNFLNNIFKTLEKAFYYIHWDVFIITVTKVLEIQKLLF